MEQAHCNDNMPAVDDAMPLPKCNLGIVLNGVAPYNYNLISQCARQLPQVKITAAFTTNQSVWKMTLPEEVQVRMFDPGSKSKDGWSQSWSGFNVSLWRVGGQILQYLLTNKVDAVIIAGYAGAIQIRLIRGLSKTGVKVFIRGDSNIRVDEYVDRTRPWSKRIAKQWAWKWVHQHITGVMGMGEYGRDYMLKYGAKSQQFFNVPCYPDCVPIEQITPTQKKTFQDQWKLDPARKFFGYCGRFVELKRLDLLIDAFVKVADHRPDWDLLMVGSGEEEAKLRNKIPDRLQNRVHWTGFLQPEDLKKAYHAMDIFVLPSRTEAWGVVIEEAASAGCVIVSSNRSSAANEIVDDGVSGILVEPENFESLYDAMLDTSDPAKFKQYQASVRPALESWRSTSDPIDGIRQALIYAGVLSADTTFIPRSSQT